MVKHYMLIYLEKPSLSGKKKKPFWTIQELIVFPYFSNSGLRNPEAM